MRQGSVVAKAQVFLQSFGLDVNRFDFQVGANGKAIYNQKLKMWKARPSSGNLIPTRSSPSVNVDLSKALIVYPDTNLLSEINTSHVGDTCDNICCKVGIVKHAANLHRQGAGSRKIIFGVLPTVAFELIQTARNHPAKDRLNASLKSLDPCHRPPPTTRQSGGDNALLADLQARTVDSNSVHLLATSDNLLFLRTHMDASVHRPVVGLFDQKWSSKKAKEDPQAWASADRDYLDFDQRVPCTEKECVRLLVELEIVHSDMSGVVV